METIELTYPHPLKVDELRPTIATIGFFDGVHLGHQRLIHETVEKAKNDQMQSAVITFHPHPSVVLSGSKDIKYITPMIEKEKILENFRVEKLYVIKFNKELSLLSPEQFIDHFIVGLNVKHLIAGFDFTYGNQGKGNMNNLSIYAKNRFSYKTVSKVKYNHEKVSSSKIRNLLGSGEVQHIKQLLGRTYSLIGSVIKGDQRGRTIGFPTANLNIRTDKLLPKSGVYAVNVYYDNKTYKGMANIGVRPTFTNDLEPSVEVHLLDFDEDIYGEIIEMELLKFVRNEKKFASVDAIITQLKSDEEEIRDFFRSYEKK